MVGEPVAGSRTTGSGDAGHGAGTTGREGGGAGGRRATWKWLAVAFVLLCFANGRDVLAPAAWLAPLFLLRVVRLRSVRSGLALAYLALTATWCFQFRGMVPLPPIGFAAVAAVFGAIGLIPLAVDRVVAPRLGGFAATFVLPTAWATTDWLVSRFSPYGSWGSPAYSQLDQLALLQILSVTGLTGLTFLLGWFAAVVNWAWERDFEWRIAGRGLLALVLVLAGVLLAGEARLRLFPPSAPTVRVASMSSADTELFPDAAVARRARSGAALTPDELEAVRRRARAIDDDLLERSRREARAGARIVLWGETNGFAFSEDEPELLARGGRLASEEGIYLGMAYASWERGAARPLGNKLVLVGPTGEVMWSFVKAIPVPGSEAAISARGDGRLREASTPYGRLGGAICFDMDFPHLLGQAGRLGVDLLLAPSNDWPAIDPFHTFMARYRAIEQGFNLVRQTSHGLSIACDAQGRVLATMDHFTASDRVLVAQVPILGARTPYARVGDLFPGLCAVSLVLLMLAAIRRR